MATLPTQPATTRPLVRSATAFLRFATPTAIVVSVLAVASTGAEGCTSDDTRAAVDAAVDHSSIVVVPDVSTSFEATVDATPLQTNVRVALMSDFGFGIDICVRTVGSSAVVTSPYVGPLLFEKLPSFPDAGSDAGKHVDADAAHLDGTLRDGPEAGDGRVVEADAPARDGEAGLDAVADVASDTSDASLDVHEAGEADAPRGAIADAALDAVALADAGERVGGVPGKQVSTYLSIQGAGTFDVAIVLGGSSSCADAISVRTVTLDPGKYTTLVVTGALSSVKDGGSDAAPKADAAPVDATLAQDASPDGARDASRDVSRDVANDVAAADAGSPTVVWSLVALTDEPALSTSLAKARFFNAAGLSNDAGIPTALRVSAIGQSASVPIASDVPPGRASLPNPASPAVDSLGYWEGTPVVSTVPVSLRATPASAAPDAAKDHEDGGALPSSWTFQSTSFDLVAATDHTGFFVGGGNDPLELVWCDDTTSSGASALTSCAVTTGQ